MGDRKPRRIKRQGAAIGEFAAHLDGDVLSRQEAYRDGKRAVRLTWRGSALPLAVGATEP
jgi:hypothetical protein